MENISEIIFDTDAIAAKQMTVTGWVSRNGRFYGKDENLARYDGSTHKKCECGHIYEKTWIYCEFCRSKKALERYHAYPFEEMTADLYNDPVFLFDGDQYFFDIEDIEMYLEDNELEPEDLILVKCKRSVLSEIDGSRWDDELAEGEDLPKEVKEKLNELNEAIRNTKLNTWFPAKIKTKYIRVNG